MKPLRIGVASVVAMVLGIALYTALGAPETLGFAALLFGPGFLAAVLSRGGQRSRDFIVAAVAASLTVGLVAGIGNESENNDNAPGVVLVGTTVAIAGLALVGSMLIAATIGAVRLVSAHVRAGRPQVGARQEYYEPIHRDPTGGRGL